jgi:hypothetical protein
MIDAVVNVVLGGLLLLFPAGVLELLGLPQTNTFFYPSILGAVILGIGIALFIELFGRRAHIRGLGLGGAIAINLCGGGALLVWLVAVPLGLPLRGTITLWVVAMLVLGIGVAEIASRAWVYDEAAEQAEAGEKI